MDRGARLPADHHPAGDLPRPLAPEAAVAYVDAWLDLPYVEIVGPGPQHWSILRMLLRSTGTAGNLTSDAHLAALAIEHRCPLYSSDADFGRFRPRPPQLQ